MMRFVSLSRAAEKIGCSVDDILEVAWPEEYSKPNFWIYAAIGDGDYTAQLVENNGERVSSRMEMSVDGQHTLLRYDTIEQIYNKRKYDIGYFVPSPDEFCNEDWTWWRLLPRKEIGIESLAIESGELQRVRELLVHSVAGRPDQNTAEPEGSAIGKEWKSKARELAAAYLAAWRAAGYEPTKNDAALYVEGIFSTDGVYGDHRQVLDVAYIERHALSGITGNPQGYKPKKPKVPPGMRGNLPEKK